MLIIIKPRIIAFGNNWATAKKSFRLFKLYQTISKTAIIANSTNEPWFENLESEVEIHKD